MALSLGRHIGETINVYDSETDELIIKLRVLRIQTGGDGGRPGVRLGLEADSRFQFVRAEIDARNNEADWKGKT